MKRENPSSRAAGVLRSTELAAAQGAGLPQFREPVAYTDRGASVRQVDTPRGDRPIMYAERGGERESGTHRTIGSTRGTQVDMPRQSPWDWR